jgi:hypothetical protein
MFQWYKHANICYAYLSDIQTSRANKHIYKSRWWTRGWTLQELIAPRLLEFYSKDWKFLGTKLSEIYEIEDFTGIRANTLLWGQLAGSNAAEVMSWIRHRECTRAEDLAYCLFGLFRINMPLLYGEGGIKAFLRLQGEILRRNEDETIYLFARCPNDTHTSLLAENPWQFCRVIDCVQCNSKNAIDCLPEQVVYAKLQASEPNTTLQSVSSDINLSGGGLRVTFRSLELNQVENMIPKMQMQGVSKVLVTNIWESTQTLFAIPLGQRAGAKSLLDAIDQGLYRLSRMPISVPYDHCTSQSTRMVLTAPWWNITQNYTTLILELGNPRFVIAEAIERRDSIERNSTIKKTDSRLILTTAGPAIVNSILWLAKSPQDHVNLLFGTFLLRTKEDTSCILIVKEVTNEEGTRMITETQHVSDISREWTKDAETMISAEYSALHLEDGRILVIRSSRKNSKHALQGGYAKANSKVFRFKIDLSFQ